MTPADHLDKADNLLAQVGQADTELTRNEAIFIAVWALAHATVALAIELGVPHVTPPAEGASSAG